MTFTDLIDRILYYFTFITRCFPTYIKNYESLNNDDIVEYSFLPSKSSPTNDNDNEYNF